MNYKPCMCGHLKFDLYLLAGHQSQGSLYSITVLLSKYATVGNLYKKGMLFMSRPPYQMPRCVIPTRKLCSSQSCKISQPIHSSRQQLNRSKATAPAYSLQQSFYERSLQSTIFRWSATSLFSGRSKLVFIWCSTQQTGSGVGNEPKGKPECMTVKWLLISLGSNDNQLFHFLCCADIINLTSILCSTHPCYHYKKKRK